jgi:hypothetical protein
MPRGTDGSILTYYLGSTLLGIGRQHLGRVTYRDLIEEVGAKMATLRADQTPQIEGTPNALLFSGEQVADLPPYALVSDLKPGPPIEVTLNQGALHGVTVGSRYDLYEPGSQPGGSAARLAQAEVTAVRNLEATAKISPPAPNPALLLRSRAFEVEHRFEGAPLKVVVASVPVEPKNEDLDRVNAANDRSIRERLAHCDFVKLVDPTSADFDVRLGWRDGSYCYQRANGTRTSVGDVPNGDQVVTWLTGDWRWQRIAALSRSGERKVRLQILPKSAVVDENKVVTDDPHQDVKRTPGGRILLERGDEARIVCTNFSPRELFITLIYLKSDGGIEVWPRNPFAQEPIAGDGKARELFQIRNVWPGSTPEVEMLKVIATPQQVDLSGLNQTGATRQATRGPLNPLQKLLFGLHDGSWQDRGAHITWKSSDIAEWDFDQIVYEIRPK